MINLYFFIDKLRLICEVECLDFVELTKEAFNVRVVEIDKYSNIRIESPCESHWLNNEEMQYLITYINENYIEYLNKAN